MKRVVVAVGAVLAVVVVTALAADWRFLRPVVEQIASDKLGRNVTLTGFRMSLLPHLRMHFEGLRIPDAPGSRRAEIISVDEAEVQLALWPALHGRVVLDALAMRGGELYLSRNKQGVANWTLPGLPDPATVRAVSLDQLLVFYDDRQDDVVLNLRVGRNPVRATAKAYPVFTEIDGTFRNSRFKGNAWTGTVLTLRESETPFQFKLDATIGSSRLKAEGMLADVLGDRALDVTVDASGHALSSLYPFVDIPLEATSPYSMKGRFLRDENKYTVSDLSATLGKSDLSGNATYEKRPGRPFFNAALRSQVLDVKDFAPVLGLDRASEEEPPPAKTSARKAEPVKKADPDKRLVPDLAFDPTRLNRLDADVTLDVGTARALGSVFDSVKTHLVLEDRVLKLAPMDLGYGGGQLNATLTIDARNQSPRAEATVALRKARLNRMFPELALVKRNTSSIGVDIALKGQGTSLRTLLAHANGTMSIAAAGGELSSLFAEVASPDAAQAMGVTIGGEKKTPLRCAAASFTLKQGLATSTVFAFDTPATLTRGSGTVSFGDERLDFRLEPEGRDNSASVARALVNVQGTLAYPQFRTQRGAAQPPGAPDVASMAAIAALVPYVDAGYGREANCNALLGKESPREAGNSGRRRR